MKKFLILGFFAVLSIVACKNAETTPAEEAAPVETEDVNVAPATENDAAEMPAEEAAPAEGEAPAENE